MTERRTRNCVRQREAALWRPRPLRASITRHREAKHETSRVDRLPGVRRHRHPGTYAADAPRCAQRPRRRWTRIVAAQLYRQPNSRFPPGPPIARCASFASASRGARPRALRSCAVRKGILGGLADYATPPFAFAIDVARGELDAVLAPLASEQLTTTVGFTERGAGDASRNCVSREAWCHRRSHRCLLVQPRGA